MAEPVTKRARAAIDASCRTIRLVDEALEEGKAVVTREMYAANELTDVVLRSGDGGEYRAHRVVLASASLYFRRAFVAGAGAAQETLELKEVDATGLKLALRFLYDGQVDVQLDGQMDSLVAALYTLEMQPLLAKCIDAILLDLTPGSALPVYELAAAYNLEALAKSALKLASEQFAAAVSDPSWPKLALTTVKTLLSRDELHTLEVPALEALLRWVRADEQARTAAMEDLLPLIRFPLMDEDEIDGGCAVEPLVTGTKCWGWLREEARKFHLQADKARALDSSPRTHLRGERTWMLYHIGGMDGKMVLSSTQRWVMRTEAWESVAALGKARVGHGCATLGGMIYAVGGSDGVHRLSDVERFCPWQGKWEAVAPLSCARGDVGVVSLNGMIYAIGGRKQFEPLASVERYCPVRGSWEAVAPLSLPRYHVRCAALDGHVYAIGGGEQTRVNGCTTVERFSARLGVWEPVPPMPTSREGVGIAVLDGKIYATGGFDGTDKLKSCEAFCPVRNQWEPVPPMIAARMSHRCAVLEGKLYVLGGFKGDGECFPYDAHGRLSTVECFDPQTNTWEAVPSMSAEAAKAGSRWHCHGALVVL
ncbi:hypothetical protein T492DRAFT_1072806 [Pavlovales sp. CCMP2436]|nr:hypothetical protein T492DRAFT_1072806 [Pavlovales sp. CCMP2436]|mmetsp:Transcript_4653/g.11949  ORF Transcript_4653/g.11949 Transcript_4653/m.11949 type:complete len:594 (-) Transcript_4653:377-2158(-)